MVQCTEGNYDGLPGNLNQLFEPPYNEHVARVHSNSWGLEMEDEQHEYESSAKSDRHFRLGTPRDGDMLGCR